MRARGILSLALGACVGVGLGGCGPRSGATTPDPDDLPPLRVRLSVEPLRRLQPPMPMPGQSESVIRLPA